MKIRNTNKSTGKIELQMTPMIDIVFQLLVFFIMSFKIASVEGDFNIKMPLGAPREGVPDPHQLPPIKLKLSANSSGQLTKIQLNQKSFGREDWGRCAVTSSASSATTAARTAFRKRSRWNSTATTI